MGLTASTTINFGIEAATVVDYIELELLGIDNGGKTKFSPGERANIRVYGNKGGEVYMTSFGEVVPKSQGHTAQVVENIEFINERVSTLSRLPIGGVTHEWIGYNRGGVSIEGQKVSLVSSGATVGILRCTYETKYDLVSLRNITKPLEVLVYVYEGKNESSLTVDFTGTGGLPKDVTLVVKDYCTDLNIDLVQVIVDGPYNYHMEAVTDINGSVYLGILNPGKYTLVMTKVGYIDSNKDILFNDSFTI